MKPQLSDLHIDRMLTEISVAYSNGAYIIDQLFPRVYVNKQSDKYYVFEKQQDIVDDRVRPGGIAKEIEWSLSSDSFYCDGHAIREAVYDRQRRNADDGLDLDATAAENVQDQILRNREYAGATLVFAAGTYASGLKTQLSGTAQWSDLDDSDPLGDIMTGKKAVMDEIGLEPNTLVLGYETWHYLRQNVDLMTKYNSVEKRLLTVEMVKELLEVPRIVIGKAMYNSANQGQTATSAYMWGKHASLLYVPERPAQKTPAFGYTFVWKGENGADGVVTYKYRNEDRHADIIENEFYYDHKVVVQNCGYFIQDAVA